MSLINQMLKELDARRSDVGSPESYGQQVRVVHERRRIHPAWFVAAAAVLLLVLLVAWLLVRPVPPIEPQRHASQLPLRLEIDLTKVSPQEAAAPAEQSATPMTAVPVGGGESQSSNPDSPNVVPAPPSSAIEKMPQASHSAAQAPSMKPRNASPESPAEPIVSKVVPTAKVLADPLIREVATVAPPVLNKKVQELTPQQRAENEYRKALQAMQENKLGEATRGFETALQINALHVGARYALIGALLDSNRQEEAVARAREGLTLDAAQPGLSMILARLQLEKGEVRPAIETLERTLPYAADRADYQAFLAALQQRDERHKQAIEHYLAALQKSPENGVWWMGLGISLQAERRLAEAVEAFKRAKASNTLSQELIAFVDSRIAQLQR